MYNNLLMFTENCSNSFVRITWITSLLSNHGVLRLLPFVPRQPPAKNLLRHVQCRFLCRSLRVRLLCSGVVNFGLRELDLTRAVSLRGRLVMLYLTYMDSLSLRVLLHI